MAWQTITAAMLLQRVTAPERDALAAAAAAEGQQPLDEIVAALVEEWRGGLRRVTRLAVGPKLPSELVTHVLADFRYRAYTRLPGMAALLDELRVKEWDRAMHVRDHLDALQYAPPAAGEAEPVETSGKPRPAISDAVSVLE